MTKREYWKTVFSAMRFGAGLAIFALLVCTIVDSLYRWVSA